MTFPTLLPFAIHKLIAPGSSDPTIFPIGNVFHVAVSEASSLHDFFDGPSGGIESHGYIRRDGTVEQYRTLDREADAQAAGNSFTFDGKRCGFLSWETQGMGDGEWTPEQVATIKRIMQFTHDEIGVPLIQAPAWNRPGNGYHSLFPEWNPNAHSCPGPDRIKQWPNIINPEDDMTPEDLLNFKLPAADNQTVRAVLVTEYNRGARLEAALAAIAAGLGPTVEAAVKKVLVNDINVELTVRDETA